MAKQDKYAELTEYWQQRVAGWQESGQSHKVFCEANDPPSVRLPVVSLDRVS